MHVFAQGRGRAVVGDGAVGKRLVNKPVDGVAAVGTRAVQRAVTQDGVRQVVHGLIVFDIQFAGLFAATVKTAGLAVHVQGTGKNIALYASLAAGLKHHDVAQHVDARSIHRAVVGLADVGNASIVEDHIRTGYGAVDGFFIQNIACKHCLVGPQKWRGMQVNNGDRMPGFRKLVADMRAQKTGPAKDGNIHSYSPELGRSAARHKKTESMP